MTRTNYLKSAVFTSKPISSERFLHRLWRGFKSFCRFVASNIKVLGLGVLIVGMFAFLAPKAKHAEAAQSLSFGDLPDVNVDLPESLHGSADYDLDKLADAVAFAETASCTDGTAVKRKNCFGIMHWPNGVRTPKVYKSHAESYADFKRIWAKSYGRFPDQELAARWTGNDHPDTWLANVKMKYSQL